MQMDIIIQYLFNMEDLENKKAFKVFLAFMLVLTITYLINKYFPLI